MIRIERVILPDGLRALARRNENGDLVIYVSNAIDARRQRAAVMEAIRASRRAGWRAGLPIVIALLAGLQLTARRAATAIRARPVAWTGAAVASATAVVVASVLLPTSARSHDPAPSAPPPFQRGSTRLPSRRPGAHPARSRGGGQVQPVAAIPATSPAAGARRPQPGQTSPVSGQPPPGSTTTPAPPSPTSAAPSTAPPAPTPTPSATPSPSPSPSVSGGQPGSCVPILVVRVCVPLRITLLVSA